MRVQARQGRAAARRVRTGGAAPGRTPRVARAARDTALLLAALALCPLAALVIGDDPSGPARRAQALMQAERALGLHFEPAVHGWALRHGWLMTGAGVFYVFAHVPVAAWALIWTWCLRRDAFPLVRDLFLATQAACVALYALAPTAPPRLVPGSGFADTLTGLWGREVADSAHLVQSPFAAMPSGHVAFALVAGGTFAAIGDRPGCAFSAGSIRSSWSPSRSSRATTVARRGGRRRGGRARLRDRRAGSARAQRGATPHSAQAPITSCHHARSASSFAAVSRRRACACSWAGGPTMRIGPVTA